LIISTTTSELESKANFDFLFTLACNQVEGVTFTLDSKNPAYTTAVKKESGKGLAFYRKVWRASPNELDSI